MGPSYEVFKLHILARTILVGCPLNVFHNLLSFSVVLGPVWIVLEQKLKTRSRSATCDSRVSVFQPDTPNVYRYLISQ